MRLEAIVGTAASPERAGVVVDYIWNRLVALMSKSAFRRSFEGSPYRNFGGMPGPDTLDQNSFRDNIHFHQ